MKQNNHLRIFSFGFIISLLCFSCTTEDGSKNLGRIPGYHVNGPAGHWDSADWNRFHQLALEESMLPVRPGEPGLSPFWNGHARRFINVPSFDFPAVNNAVRYRYTAISDANTRAYTFETNNPWSLLSAVWKDLPVGIVYLKVEGLDRENDITGIAGERMFYMAAPFNGP